MALDAALIDQVTRELRGDEGTKYYPYDDATGRAPILAFWHGNQLVPSPGKLSIGVGRNLSAKPLSDAVVTRMLNEDIAEAERGVRKFFVDFDKWTQNRRAAVLNLVFNMGEETFSGFHETVPLMQAEQWSEAADHLAASAWAHEVQPSRRDRVVSQIRNG